MEKGTFPTVIDSTALADFALCPRRFYWRWARKKTPTALNTHTTFGKAFASGLEAARLRYLEDSDTPADALAAVAIRAAMRELGDDYDELAEQGEAKTPTRLAQALTYYLTEAWPLGADGLVPEKPEYTFAIDTGFRHPDTGDPLLFAGRFDLLARDEVTGEMVIVDDKTTSALGDRWLAQWRMRGQFLAYAWAARTFGIRVSRCVVRGLAILKTKFAHAEAFVYTPDWRLDEWEEWMRHHLALVIAYYQRGQWPKVYSAACSMYGECPYADLCMTPDTRVEEVAEQYEEAEWSPLDNRNGL